MNVSKISGGRSGVQFADVIDFVSLDKIRQRVILNMDERRPWEVLDVEVWRDELLAKANAYLQYIAGALFQQFPEVPWNMPGIWFLCMRRPPEAFLQWLIQLKRLLGEQGVDFEAVEMEARAEIEL